MKKIYKCQDEEDYYLIDFFLGQAMFRKEIENNDLTLNTCSVVINHLEESLVYFYDFADSHILLGLIKIAKSNFVSNHSETLQEAKKHFQIVLKKGNSSQIVFCNEKISFINSKLDEKIIKIYNEK